MLRLAVEAQGHEVVEATNQPEAAAALVARHPAVVLSDLRLTDGDGFGVLRAAKELDPQLPVIVMTAFGSIQPGRGQRDAVKRSARFPLPEAWSTPTIS